MRTQPRSGLPIESAPREPDPDRERWGSVATSILLQANDVERERLVLVDRMQRRERAADVLSTTELAFHRKQVGLLKRIADWRQEEVEGLRELAAFARECGEG